MKRISLIVFAVIIGVMPMLASAQGGITPVPPDPEANLLNIINSILNWVFGLLLVLAALFIIYAAFLYLTSGGDEEKIKSAKNYIVYAVVAIIVGFLARAVVVIVRGIIGISN